ncbi:jg13882 [Pararge aegeria aegeria]|uniref:Jg13882 protein n=1 Tax=Pararge aegeria aegeria TaxID=348720 RepID=A0A8S4S581_9NEOP|nr:jg13882 [Pararge aegeria aegeria]
MFMEPTRITATSATCLDNIFTNIIPISKNIISKLDSDHCGQIIQFENVKKNVSKRKITFVPVTSNRIEKMRISLVNDLPFLPSGATPNAMYSSFFNTFNRLFHSIFTSKSVVITDTLNFSEWATVELHKNRQKLYELYAERQFNTGDKFGDYVKLFSKNFKRACHLEKTRYIKNKIKNSSNAIKTTWNIINEETGRVTPRNINFKLNVDNKALTTDFEVATAFETFFTNIPVSTTESLNSSPDMALSLLKENVPECNHSFKFTHVSGSDVIKAFKLLIDKKTNDLWGISVNVVKSLIDIVAPDLALIFNNCIDCGVFPDLMKLSKIVPLFKSGSTSDPTNFRPVSVLPSFSKIFEKLILNQLLYHFHKYNLLHIKQFGFTRGRSTIDAGVELIQNIFVAWEESRDALGVFCDLSKAFDCVQHETLVRKLHHYGIQGVALDLMSNYLRDRIQKVDVNGKRSNGSVMKIGVPQGSILGPFLFLIYINDLPYLYFSYFHSIMSYGILLWGNAADISTIFVLQKRAVRSIYKMGPRESLRDKFKDFKIMTVYSQYIFENLIGSAGEREQPSDRNKRPMFSGSRWSIGGEQRGVQMGAARDCLCSHFREPHDMPAWHWRQRLIGIGMLLFLFNDS